MAEYRVDELARTAGTTVGNVRVYQDRDLLPPPLRRGRVAVYTEAHLARLRLILGLLKRQYSFAQIREMITTWQTGRDLEHLLGLERVLTEPWTDEAPERIPLADLAAEFGAQVNAETLDRLARIGVFRIDGDHVLVLSPRLLHTGRQLIAAGIPVEAVLGIAEQAKHQTDQLAAVFVDMVDSHVLPSPGGNGRHGRLDDSEVPGLTDKVGRLRPLAQAAVSAFLADSMSRALGDWLTGQFGPLLRDDYSGKQ
ncbi:MerR family transcriptional regulator [Prauserella marina]|uniref:MerR HTH family regulatory protein n=1 Tax=Prauserella marina TaxID=530584 RepID=A0A222VXJ2_9PSEU|nr:MerR family transcriptional regulator [Prauserella marina]ASR38658.1 MerR family transcriptional regulator [Prauserella marina]PWV81989.1 MerR-like DNA binding protein [Prauserella marina]SDD16863.1 MerR HTH family regulatory protein [Prauserella marina]